MASAHTTCSSFDRVITSITIRYRQNLTLVALRTWNLANLWKWKVPTNTTKIHQVWWTSNKSQPLSSWPLECLTRAERLTFFEGAVTRCATVHYTDHDTSLYIQNYWSLALHWHCYIFQPWHWSSCFFCSVFEVEGDFMRFRHISTSSTSNCSWIKLHGF